MVIRLRQHLSSLRQDPSYPRFDDQRYCLREHLAVIALKLDRTNAQRRVGDV